MAIGNTWTNVTSRTITKGSATVTFWIDVKLNKQDIAGNYSVVDTRLTSTITNNLAGSGYKFTLTGADDLQGDGVWTFSNTTILTGQTIVYHTNPNSDGTKTSSVSASVYNKYWSINESFSGNYVLPKIDRYPMLLTAPNFNDTENPKITYTNVLGLTGATVQVGIYNSAGTTAYVTATLSSTDISNGEYTFQLTDAQRNTLRSATPNSNTMQVKFRLITTASGTNYEGDALTKTLTIVNANPTMTPTYTEQNAKVSALLGTTATTVVKNASKVRVSVTASAQKSATISKVQITHNNTTYTDTTSPYSLDINIKANSMNIKAIDSRGNSNNNNAGLTKTWSGSNYIDYQPVQITNLTMKRQTQTSSNIILNLEATYYQKTFGSTANEPVIKWKLGDGSYTTIPSSNYTIDTTNNKVTITNYTLSGVLPYTEQGQFTLYIEDKLTTYTESGNRTKVTEGIAVFELGKSDAKVNGEFKSTGRAMLKQGSTVGKFSNGGGTTGYMKVAKLVIDQTYMNGFIVFEVTQRKRHGIVYLQFAGGNTKDPAIQTLEVDGTTKAYIYKTATSTWDLYIQKSESYDTIDVVRLHKGQYSDKIAITWYDGGETVSSLPSGNTASTPYDIVKLYDNGTTGTNGNVTLSESSANFAYIEIFFRSNNNDFSSIKVYMPNGKTVSLSINHPTGTGTNANYFKTKTMSISGTSMTNQYYSEVAFANGGTITITGSNYIYVTRVVGYRKG